MFGGNLYMKSGELIAELRMDKGLSQRELGKLVNNPVVRFVIMKKILTYQI